MDEGVWEVLRGKLVDLLGKEDRSEEEDLTIERLLILVRNVLQVHPSTVQLVQCLNVQVY